MVKVRYSLISEPNMLITVDKGTSAIIHVLLTLAMLNKLR